MKQDYNQVVKQKKIGKKMDTYANLVAKNYRKYTQESKYIGDRKLKVGRAFVTFAVKGNFEPVMCFKHIIGYSNWRRQLQAFDGYYFDPCIDDWIHWSEMEWTDGDYFFDPKTEEWVGWEEIEEG